MQRWNECNFEFAIKYLFRNFQVYTHFQSLSNPPPTPPTSLACENAQKLHGFDFFLILFPSPCPDTNGFERYYSGQQMLLFLAGKKKSNALKI